MFGCFRLRLKSSKRSAAAIAAWDWFSIAVGEASGRMIVRRTSVLPSQALRGHCVHCGKTICLLLLPHRDSGVNAGHRRRLSKPDAREAGLEAVS